jgi:hypothetical protein
MKFVWFLVQCVVIRPSVHPFCDKLSHFVRFVHSPSFHPPQAFALGGLEPVDDEDDNDDDDIKKKKCPTRPKPISTTSTTTARVKTR